jgi:hypothetical protein
LIELRSFKLCEIKVNAYPIPHVLTLTSPFFRGTLKIFKNTPSRFLSGGMPPIGASRRYAG